MYNFFCLCVSSSYLFHPQTKNRFSMVQYVGSNNRKPRNPLVCHPIHFERYITSFTVFDSDKTVACNTD